MKYALDWNNLELIYHTIFMCALIFPAYIEVVLLAGGGILSKKNLIARIFFKETSFFFYLYFCILVAHAQFRLADYLKKFLEISVKDVENKTRCGGGERERERGNLWEVCATQDASLGERWFWLSFTFLLGD